MPPFARSAILIAALSVVAVPAHGQDASDWVGIWAPDGLDITLRIDLSLYEGELDGLINAEGNNPGEPVATLRAEGRRLVLTLEDGDSLTMQLDRSGQRATVRGRYGRRVSLTLKRRGSVWNLARSFVLDEMHADQAPTTSLLYDAAQVELGLRRGGREGALADPRQGMCAFDRLVLEWNGPRMSPADRGAYLARIAGSRSLCEVHPSELADPASCDRLTILDSDGATTVRASASSRSEGAGTLANGTTVSVASRRGSWIRVEGPTAGWIHSSNVHCAASR